MADAVGAVGKPLFRVHTAGSVGGSTAIVAASLVQSGVHKRVLTIGLGEAVGVEGDVGAVVPGPVQQSRWPVPVATSPRSSARTSAAPGPPTTSASWWR